MTAATLTAQIKALEAQLAVLKAQAKSLSALPAPHRPLVTTLTLPTTQRVLTLALFHTERGGEMSGLMYGLPICDASIATFPQRSQTAPADATAQVVVPTIILAEITFLYARYRITVNPPQVLTPIANAANCVVYPLDGAVEVARDLGYRLYTICERMK